MRHAARALAVFVVAAVAGSASARPAAEPPRLIFDEWLPASLVPDAVVNGDLYGPIEEGGYDSELCIGKAGDRTTLRLLRRERRFWRRSGAVWSPDGRRLAYVGLTGLDLRIEIVDAATHTVRQLQTSDDADHPAWSADGSRLAFRLAKGDLLRPSEERIAVANADGTDVRALTAGDWPVWSPDGSQIAFSVRPVRNPHYGELALVASGGGTPNVLTSGLATPTSWSPDGRWITFSRSTDFKEHPDVELISPDGTSRHRLIADGTAASWSPDGTRIAFIRGHEVYVANADGSDVVRVTDSPAEKFHPVWPPVGLAPAAKAGACDITGTPGADTLAGTPQRDVLYGRRGADRIDGRGGGDVVFAGGGADRVRGAIFAAGGTGNDIVTGTPARDELRGGPGPDRLFGRAGRDALIGGLGDDVLDGGSGTDYLLGGPGNDVVLARDGRREVIDCGPGTDRAIADRIDRLSSCERTTRGVTTPARR